MVSIQKSLDFCDTYSFDFDTNNIDSLFGINQHNGIMENLVATQQ